MILTDEEIEKCRELAFHAAKKSQQSCKGQQVTPSDDYEYQFAWAIEAAILAELEAALREARDTLQHYLHGGSSYRKPADATIATISC